MKNVQPIIDIALNYRKIGFSPIPIIAGQKRAAIKWKQFQTERPTERNLAAWFSTEKHDIALVTGNGIVVVDVDDPGFLAQVIQNCGDTPMRCQTPGAGTHLYYSMRPGIRYGNVVRLNGDPVDLRCDGGYVVCPPSCNAGVNYEWEGPIIPASELPPINMTWLQPNIRRTVAQLGEFVPSGDMVRRARGYLANIEGAVSGQRGHDRTFRVACVLTIKFGLSLEEAWPLFEEWNQQCEPRWSEKELLHKLQDALRLRSHVTKGR